MSVQSKQKARNKISFIFLLSIFIILAIYLIANIYFTSMSGTKYSENKTNQIFECIDFKNPIYNVEYNKKTNTLSFIFENYDTNTTINKVFFETDKNQTIEFNLDKQFKKYTLEIEASKKITYYFDICEGNNYSIDIK